MDRYPLTSSFARQFQQEESLHFAGETVPCRRLLFKNIRTTEQELRRIGNWLAPQLHDEVIMQNLRDKLIMLDVPGVNCLSAFIQKTRRDLDAQASAEPYTSHYYSHLIRLFDNFLLLVEDFNQHGVTMIASLCTEYFNAENKIPANAEAAGLAHCIMEDFMYQIMEYFQQFDMLLQKESASQENKGGLLVKSYVSQYLETMILHTENLIRNTDETVEMIRTWETALQAREEQVMYN